ncbi:hypothetical protein E2C01_078016 [Portunus trituberculatus]|uniref:Uncharacterized protein n=1 Tax=Portunus trituberculatus TaxID=210409 RepID=A0A5B7IMS9_PORTR|nr:hypothetical protein [Portunus trituberculatus]
MSEVRRNDQKPLGDGIEWVNTAPNNTKVEGMQWVGGACTVVEGPRTGWGACSVVERLPLLLLLKTQVYDSLSLFYSEH